MIAPRDDQFRPQSFEPPAPEQPTREQANPEQLAPEQPNPMPAADPTGWDIESLPPELDYFRRSDAYQVELSGFQGPLDLLLYLIQKDEIDIYDIPISGITDKFIRHIEIMQMVSLDMAGEFMAMAATLLVIKMKMLMPKAPGEPEEETEDDPRAELVKRLLEYKRFKEAAGKLRECEEQRVQYHLRTTRYPFLGEVEVEPELKIEMYDLLSALADIFDRVRARPVHEIKREPYTVVEKIALVLDRLQESETVRFVDCFRDDAIKMEVIVTFIAILELVKRGQVAVFQTEIHGVIWLQMREDHDAEPTTEMDATTAATSAQEVQG